MILESQCTGEIEAVLLEQGYLTNLRTALAGAVAAKYLAPPGVTRIGIFGTVIITAMGSNTESKTEIAPGVLGRAAYVVADSIAQCAHRGEIRHAVAAHAIRYEDVLELGNVVRRPKVIDRQDLMIAEAVLSGAGG